MKAILHGTWIVDADGRPDEQFFVWAERPGQAAKPRARARGIQRHPYAATALEIGELLSAHAPAKDWRAASRLTRIAFVPTGDAGPLVPRWLSENGAEPDESPAELKPWRVEGLGVSLLEMLDLFVVLPMLNHRAAGMHRVGNDLRYWGIAAKFALELMTRERFLPGLRLEGDALRAVWLPMLDLGDEGADDGARFRLLAEAMPAACRALFRDRASLADLTRQELEALSPEQSLLSFLESLLDQAVREWGQLGGGTREPLLPGDLASDVAAAWWRALWSADGAIKVASAKESELDELYRSWQRWSYQTRVEVEAPFRVCFRLEPPAFDEERKEVVSRRWVLRYFLQATDDPSLLVPAREVWRERGSVLSYLNRRFDEPQERLLQALGMAARLCPAIRRSLFAEAPESTELTDEEAFTFLRETARLLEGLGFAVLVPPWWSKPDARLRVKARLKAPADGTGVLNMNSLVAFDWELALGDETLTREEFERLAALKTPLVQVRGRWVLLQPDQIEAAIAFWEKRRAQSTLELGEALGLALGAEGDVDGLPVSDLELDEGLSRLMDALTGREGLEMIAAPEGLHGQLRPYQERGLSWLSFLRDCRFGACLADDMGLGKT
ncbi:MAG: hypothetical protein FJZ90_01780, partial [Chloroflexi bacterium]|nr:hypothetical protein [Chloroflexota bacterium]